jgi:hypothetical protein
MDEQREMDREETRRQGRQRLRLWRPRGDTVVQCSITRRKELATEGGRDRDSADRATGSRAKQERRHNASDGAERDGDS